jgi:hypothetical protein
MPWVVFAVSGKGGLRGKPPVEASEGSQEEGNVVVLPLRTALVGVMFKALALAVDFGQ